MDLDVSIPSYRDLLWPTLSAVREIGDSGTIEEIVEKVIALESFSEDQQAIAHGDGPSSEIEYRLAWARTYLKGMGALNNSERGVWSTTEPGREMTPEDVAARHAAYSAQLRAARKQRKATEVGRDGSLAGEADGEFVPATWKERLLETLLEIPPDSFERLARRLLREAGFISATVTGKSGDGGIDGIGVYRLSLVSFPGARLSRRDERSWRQGTPHHDRQLHDGRERGGDARRSAAG